MKNILLLSLICCTSCAFAQKSFFGVDAGINVANQRTVSETVYLPDNSTFDNVAFQFNAVKPTFGIFYQYELSNPFALRLKAAFMGLGYNQKGDLGGGDVSINYLTLPLTLNYHVTKSLTFLVGPYLSFTLSGSQMGGQPITTTYHKNDFGLSIGGEQDVSNNFTLSISYFIGVKNIILADEVHFINGSTSYKYTNRALQFTLIYKFKKAN